jgi:hypothetical protein
MKRGWFGPKVFGWGASPASWEGWLATLVMILAMVVAGLIIQPGGGAAAWIARGVIVAAYLAVVALTYRGDARTRL